MEIDNKQEMKFIDSTPDKEYPIRILIAYLEASKVTVSDNTLGLPINNEMLNIMNKANEERRVLLEEAINILRKNMSNNIERTVYVPTPLPTLEELQDYPEAETTITTTGVTVTTDGTGGIICFPYASGTSFSGIPKFSVGGIYNGAEEDE